MHRSPADRARRDTLHDAPHQADDPIPVDARHVHLEALSVVLKSRTDFRLSLVAPPACASLTLRIVNPHGEHLAEAVTCDFRDRQWWFVWSWGDAIGPSTRSTRRPKRSGMS
jgi:hypothetical protein